MPDTTDEAAKRRRVAVIAVHGVSDQRPGETATAMVNLLANLQGEDKRPAYSRFTSAELRVPVRRLEVPPHAATGKSFAQRARTLRATATTASPPIDAGLEFMSALLANYQIGGPEETYETAVLSGDRIAPKGQSRVAVDVYEMYWADLSRLTQSVFRIFAEIYQLLFHLGSLGVHAVTAAQVSETRIGTDGQWFLWARAQRIAANALAIYAPIWNLVLIGLVGILLTQSVPSALSARVVVMAGGVLAAGGIGYWTYRAYRRAKHVPPLAIITMAVAVVLASVSVNTTPRSPAFVQSALATQAWLFAALAIGAVLRLYDSHRPGAARAGLVIGTLCSAVLLFEIWRPGAGLPSNAVLDVGALASLAMAVSWIVLFVSGWIAAITGRRLVREAARHARAEPVGTPARDAAVSSADRIRRTEGTACLTLALPAAFFVMVTTILWWVIWSLAGPRVDAAVPDTFVLKVFTWLLPENPDLDLHKARDIVSAVIATSAGWGFGVLMACVAVTGILAIYGLAPSILAEVFPPRRTLDGTAMGRWLDDGFRTLRWGARLLWMGVFVVLPAGLIALTFLSGPAAQSWAKFNINVLASVSAVLLPVAAGVLAFGNRLKALTLGLRNVVDTALDVDNHLREHPRDAAPRARIAARYASLLRHVYAQGYEKIVVIAHSQGTVITADLLRFIQSVSIEHPILMAGLSSRPACPIELFTMGSPLRQLYGLRFPHLYQWARHGQTTPCQAVMPIDPSALPNPRELGVALWVNAYRSGDYIGRYLWRPDNCEFAHQAPESDVLQPWTLTSARGGQASADGPPASRREFCIGAGAHTHYWDRTAPAIAITLDELIRG